MIFYTISQQIMTTQVTKSYNPEILYNPRMTLLRHCLNALHFLNTHPKIIYGITNSLKPQIFNDLVTKLCFLPMINIFGIYK